MSYSREAQRRYRQSEKYQATRERWQEENPSKGAEYQAAYRQRNGRGPRGLRQSKPEQEYVVEDRGHDTPCWIWWRTNKRGYGVAAVGARRLYAHRVMWERLRGPIPDGLELDHLCRITSCVNPDHLEPVTHEINMSRGVWPNGRTKRTT